MATRSRISKVEKDGTITSIYCHWDGYPSHHLPILEKFYNDEKSIDELLKLGDLSSLGESLHECSAYHRDGGEDLRISHFSSKEELKKHGEDCGEEYNYLWENGSWVY